MKRIFLVGCPRSGTTLVQSLLGCTPELTTFTESHLFDTCISQRLPTPVVARSVANAGRRFLGENDLAGTVLPATAQRLSARLWRPAVRAILDILDSAAESRGRRGFIEKTPRHLHYIDLIRTADPERYCSASFVHVLRDGVAVAASLANASRHWPRHDSTPAATLSRWQSDIERSARFIEEPNHLFVDYETLVAAPDDTIIDLARRLSIPLTMADLARRHEVAASVIRPDESWKLEMSDKPIADQARRSRHLPQAQLDELEDAIDRSTFHRLIRHAVGHPEEVGNGA